MRLARFVKPGDERLEKRADFEVQTVAESGEITEINWHLDSTFNEVFSQLRKRHKKGLEVTVIDYGDSMRGTGTPRAKSVTHHYDVIMEEKLGENVYVNRPLLDERE